MYNYELECPFYELENIFPVQKNAASHISQSKQGTSIHMHFQKIKVDRDGNYSILA